MIRFHFRRAAAMTALAVASSAPLYAQETAAAADDEPALSGTVVYAEQTKFNVNLPPQMQRFRERMDDTRDATVVLIFNESSSLSQLAPEPEEETPQAAPNDRRNRRFQMFRQRENNATFVDFDNNVAIQRREFLDRTFLVEGAERPNWKLTDDVSEFLGYMCNRAVATIDTTLVEAWFTPEIPVPAGPDDYYGLPGLILVVTTDNGNRSYVATEVSLRPVSAESIAAPTEGRKVTQEEFDKIVAEKRKEMRAQRGNNREIMIRRND